MMKNEIIYFPIPFLYATKLQGISYKIIWFYAP